MGFTIDDWGNSTMIDSRDIIKRIDELESAETDLADATEELSDLEEFGAGATAEETSAARELRNDAADAFPVEDREELEALRGIARQGNYGDWDHGATLILESYFTQYAEQMAGDTGATNPDSAWPNSHIDWDAAAEELKADYTELEHAGESYLMLC